MKVYAQISIEGIKPLLFHTFPIEMLNKSKSKSGGIGNDHEEWKQTVLMDENRQLFVYQSYIVGSITAGGKQIKQGKGTINKKVGATLEVVEDKILIENRFVPKEENLMNKPSDPVYLDVRSVVNPMTKGRNLRYRIAASPGWEASCTISWDDRAVSKEDMKACVENAGLFEGIGDGRKIGFGRFKLNEFTMKKE